MACAAALSILLPSKSSSICAGKRQLHAQSKKKIMNIFRKYLSEPFRRQVLFV
jgi:hypothetical protein